MLGAEHLLQTLLLEELYIIQVNIPQTMINILANQSDFNNLFPLLIHSWVTFPSLAYKILPILYKYKNSLAAVEKKVLKKALTSVICNGIFISSQARLKFRSKCHHPRRILPQAGPSIGGRLYYVHLQPFASASNVVFVHVLIFGMS